MQTRFGQARGENLGHLNTNKIWAGKGGKFRSFIYKQDLGRPRGKNLVEIQTRFGHAKGENLGHLKYKQDLGRPRGKI